MRRVWRLYGWLIVVGLILTTTPLVGVAKALPSQSSISVTASVGAHLYLIVDSHGSIQQIFSNAPYESAPIVVLGGLEGPTLPLTQTTSDQYSQLKPSLNFRYGYIYKKPSVLSRAIYSAVFQSILFASR